MGVLAAWVVAQQIGSGRTAHLLHNTVDVAIAFAAVFALTAAAVYVPVFIAIEALLRQGLSRAAAAAIGTALAPAVLLAVMWRFSGSDDPQTVAGWLAYWAARLPEVVVGTAPFAAAGVVFGLAWSSEHHRRATPRCVERAVTPSRIHAPVSNRE